ncbi:MAG: hypothetical protein UV40_C0005G0005 [Parcubacteria group bacterium GW2011_GWA1_42_7]|nr:MAG: hypothetical protein UV34_C0009G0029 [Parcubacteria group bacterium GW2011_GWB1_42_6]KKS70102.1 MAG: hypothetical protein UV40_C0005G0005 [Parcubacteria group bacterium GW2011_GWA1_42_7]KKS92486.1 MAG: hypothetical protein UV67_C0003G0038 [Parcubacteria group bacterium GW2011_GWC1_43_12]
MSAVTEKAAFPKVHTHKQDGWELTIRCEGVYTEFVFEIAQAGDPKGFVTLNGPNICVSVGTGQHTCPTCLTTVKQFPVNLSKGNRLTRQLGEELRNKYNLEPDWQFLLALGKKAFEPYDKYFS